MSIVLPASSGATMLDPLADPRWRDLVDEAPGAGPFHHPTWLRLVAGVHGWRASACVLPAADGSLRGGLPLVEVSSRITGRRLIAVPFSDSCQPLCAEEDREELTEALDRRRRATGLDLNVHGKLPGATVVARYHGHRLALDGGFDAVTARYAKPQVLRGVRRALREGLVAEQRTDPRALVDFYRLHVLTRRRQRIPAHPRRFIAALVGMFAAGLGYIVLVRDGAVTVAAAVFLAHGDVVVFKYGASDPAALPKRPNNLLFHEAIRIACDDGRRVLDFGRTDLEHDSLRAFKRSFGSEEFPLLYTCLAARPTTVPGSRLARLGGPVIGHCPPVVARMAGSAFHAHMVT